MRKVVITYNQLTRSENPKHYKNSQRDKHSGRKLVCGKCGRKLNVGDVVYKTARKYLCKSCGTSSEI